MNAAHRREFREHACRLGIAAFYVDKLTRLAATHDRLSEAACWGLAVRQRGAQGRDVLAVRGRDGPLCHVPWPRHGDGIPYLQDLSDGGSDRGHRERSRDCCGHTTRSARLDCETLETRICRVLAPPVSPLPVKERGTNHTRERGGEHHANLMASRYGSFRL